MTEVKKGEQKRRRVERRRDRLQQRGKRFGAKLAAQYCRFSVEDRLPRSGVFSLRWWVRRPDGSEGSFCQSSYLPARCVASLTAFCEQIWCSSNGTGEVYVRTAASRERARERNWSPPSDVPLSIVRDVDLC